jgi:hypothetical protein
MSGPVLAADANPSMGMEESEDIAAESCIVNRRDGFDWVVDGVSDIARTDE